MRKSDLPVGFEDLRGEEFKERYEITELVGTTSRRIMFAGTERDTGRPVVVRLSRPLRLHDEATLARFGRRMTACGRIEHPSVVPPIDSGELFDGKLYIVSERPSGEPLDRFLARQPEGRLAWSGTRALLLGLVRGLGAAHARRLVHGSLSPACCWVQRSDSGELALRLLDLGMNANPDSEGAELATSRTTTLGDDAVFMAPEAVGGLLGDPRTDLYLIGLVAYFMLVGRPPFQGANAFQLAAMHLQTPVPAMKEAGVDVPEAVEALVLGLVAKNPDERPASMAEVEQALARLGGDGRARPVEPHGRAEARAPGKPRGRRGRAKRASAAGRGSPRQGAAEKLRAGNPSQGRGRLPGQEILDPGASIGPRNDVRRVGSARVRAPMPPVSAPVVQPPVPVSVSVPASVRSFPSPTPSLPPASVPLPNSDPSALEAEATATFRPSEVAALRGGAQTPRAPQPPTASAEPERTVALPRSESGARAGAMGPEGTVALSGSGARAGAMGPEGTVALSRSELGAPAVGPEGTAALPSSEPRASAMGPEGTVALSRSELGVRDGPEGTVAVSGSDRPAAASDPALAPPAASVAGPEQGTAMLSRSEMFAGAAPQRQRGGARVVALAEPLPSGPQHAPSGTQHAPSGPQHAPGGPQYAPRAQIPAVASGPLPIEPRKSRAGLWIVVVVLAAAAGVGVGVVLGAG